MSDFMSGFNLTQTSFLRIFFILLVYFVINRLLLNIQNYNTSKINSGTKGCGWVGIILLLCFREYQVKSWSRDQHLDRLSWAFSVLHAYDWV